MKKPNQFTNCERLALQLGLPMSASTEQMQIALEKRRKQAIEMVDKYVKDLQNGSLAK